MQRYWLGSSKASEEGMNIFCLTRRLLFIVGTRLSFILMKLQTHQCTGVGGVVGFISAEPKDIKIHRFYCTGELGRLSLSSSDLGGEK